MYTERAGLGSTRRTGSTSPSALIEFDVGGPSKIDLTIFFRKRLVFPFTLNTNTNWSRVQPRSLLTSERLRIPGTSKTYLAIKAIQRSMREPASFESSVEGML